MTVPLVGEYGGIVPNPNTQSAEDFSVNAIDWTSYQANTLGPDINAAISQFNIDFQTVNQNSQDAQDAAESANLSELSAASSANFKGRWSDATGAATVPSSYENNGRVWQLLQNIPDITADEPMEGAANWLLIDSVNMSNVRVSKIDNPLTHLFKKNKLVDTLSGTLSVTNSSTIRTYTDVYGVVRTAGIDEPREESDGWLIEGGSTNLLTYSEQFDNSDWFKGGGANVISNDTEAPDGTLTADRLVISSGSEFLEHVASINSTAATFTYSLWIKAPSPVTVRLRIKNVSGSPLSTKDVSVTTDWSRFEIQHDSTATNLQVAIVSQQAGDIYIWGAQLEELPFASSYIHTTATSTTRLPDNFSFPVMYNAPYTKEGFAFSFKLKASKFTGTPCVFSVATDSGGFFDISAFLNVSGTITFRLVNTDAVVNQVTSATGLLNDGMVHDIVCGYDGSDLFLFVDGVSSIPTSFVGEPVMIDLEGLVRIGQNSGTLSNSYQNIEDFRIYDFALNSDEVRYLG